MYTQRERGKRFPTYPIKSLVLLPEVLRDGLTGLKAPDAARNTKALNNGFGYGQRDEAVE
jgi:hypothetical protein